MRKISWILLGFIALSIVGQLSAGITIIDAKYGVLKKKRQTKNVTNILKSKADGSDRYVILANEYDKLFGNPAKRKTKQLHVKYNDGTRDQEITVNENKDLILVAAPQPEIPPMPKPEAKTEPSHPSQQILKKQPLTQGEIVDLLNILNTSSKRDAVVQMDRARELLGLPNLNMSTTDLPNLYSHSPSSDIDLYKEIVRKLANRICPRCKLQNLPSLSLGVKALGFKSVGDFLKSKAQKDADLQSTIVDKWKQFNFRYAALFQYGTICSCGCTIDAKGIKEKSLTVVNGLDDL